MNTFEAYDISNDFPEHKHEKKYRAKKVSQSFLGYFSAKAIYTHDL